MRLPEAGPLPLNHVSARQRQSLLLSPETVLRLAEGAAIVLLTTGLLLSVRRLAGVFERPLPAVGVLAAFMLLATAAALVRLAWFSAVSTASCQENRQRHRRLILWAPRIGLVLSCGALWLPQSSPVAMSAALLLVGFEEGWIAKRLQNRVGPPRGFGADGGQVASQQQMAGNTALATLPPNTSVASPQPGLRSDFTASGVVSEAVQGADVATVERTAGMATIDATGSPSLETEMVGDSATLESLQQQIQRLVLPDGSTTVQGWVRVPFEPGQRTAWAHVAFCPPLPRTPRMEFTVDAEPRARVKVGQLVPYGVRFELKLAETAPAERFVVLQFVATSPAVPSSDTPSEATSPETS